jgi:tetratricopeptide (TPR) repeat protein
VIGDRADLKVQWERDGQLALEAPVTGRVAVLADRGRPIPALDSDYPDIAVLKVAGLDGHPCVRIDTERPLPEDSFQVFGYPEEGGAVLLTPARLTYRGIHGTLPTGYLDLASDTIKPGMSGAAVLNLRSAGVCGVVVASKHPARPDGALAIPWSTIAEDLSAVLAANRAFHLQDRRWEQAATRGKRLRFRLPRVVAHFTGREDLLAQLDEALSQQGAGVITQTISGLGGVGKTQLAAAYVAAHQDEFDIAAWVRADDGRIADLADLAVALALPTEGRTPSERADDVLVFLANTDRRWLLVLDNAPGPRALTGLPNSGRGRVLVTSRHSGGYAAFGAELAVGVFDADTARQYLLARTGRTCDEGADADAVAAALGYLPLALAHVGAYCASGTGVPFSEYMRLLHDDLPSQELFNQNPEVFYEQTVAATWNTSITAAEQVAPLARPALEMMAFLAPEKIPRSFFAVLEQDSAAGRKRVADALTALHRYSLSTVDGARISVHRLLQKVVRDQLTGPDQASAVAHALTGVQRAIPEEDLQLPATWPQCQELVPHVVALAGVDTVADLNAAGLGDALNWACVFLVHAGFPDLAVGLATRAAYVTTGLVGADPDGTMTALSARSNLVAALVAAGRAGEAIALGEQVAADMERLLSVEFAFPARAILATAYQRAGRIGEAIAIQERIASDLEGLGGPDHRQTLAAWSELASSYWSAGRTAEAIAIQEQVAAGYTRLLGPDHPATLAILGNLALSVRSAGRAGEAITIEERAAADHARLLGPEHPDTLLALANLAASSLAAGRTGEAITIGEQVTADMARLLGPGHPRTLIALANLADSYRAAGRTGEAIAVMEPLVIDSERLLGPEHPDTLTARATLAISYWSAGRTGEAIAILEPLVAESERLLGPEHPDTQTALANLTAAYLEEGRVSEAVALGEQVTADCARLFGPDHDRTLGARTTLAAVYRSAGRIAEAIETGEQVAADMDRLLGPGHPGTLTVRNNLAVTYDEAGRTAEAIPLLEEILAAREQILGPDHPYTLATRSNLASAYRSAGRIAEAIETGEQVAADYTRVLGPDPLQTLGARAALADRYRSAGRIAEAIAMLEPLVIDCRRVLGGDHPETLTALGNLALAYQVAGRTSEAIAIGEQVAADRTRLLGPEHHDTLAAWANLADSYRWAGRIDEAIAIGERVAADCDQLFGSDHPSTLAIRTNLASSYWSAGRTNEAIAIEEGVAAVRERVSGRNHPDTLTALANLAASYRGAGRIDEAIAIGERVAADFRRLLGPEHPETLAVQSNLAVSYQSAGRITEAIAVGKQVVSDMERVLGPDHPRTLTARANLAKMKEIPKA